MMARYLAILVIIMWSVNFASAVQPGPDDSKWWAKAVSGTLHKGGTLANGAYMVKAMQFSSGVPGVKDFNGNIIPETDVEPMVYIEVYKDNVLIKETILTLQGGAFIDPDNEVKVTATGFSARNSREWVLEYYNPWATISIQLRAKPKFDVTVTTVEKTTPYISNSDLIITGRVTVKNSGEGYAKNVDVTLNLDGLQLRGGDATQLHQFYYEMDAGTSQSFDVILLVPNLIDEKSYNLSASAKGYDVKDLGYNSTGSILVTVTPKQNYFGISKAVRDRIYLQDTTFVRITVANGGMYDIYNIHITDNMSEHFELKSSTPFSWDIPLLKPGEEWGTAYSIKPLEANINGFTIPAATATFVVNNKHYSASSKTTTVVVNGPKILMNKTVSKPVVNISENVTVIVSITNKGDIGTKIEVKDYLPDSVSLISGSMSLANWSDPNTPIGFSYIIRMNKEGIIELPPAVANYTNVEYRGTTRSVLSSGRPNITVIDPSKITPTPTPRQSGNGNPSQTSSHGTSSASTDATVSPTNTPDPTPTPITPGFNIIPAIIVLIFAALRKR